MGAAGNTIVDFGSFPGSSDASVNVTGQATITGSSLVEAWIFPASTGDHSPDEHLVETIKIVAGNIVAGTGFTIYALNTSQLNEPLEIPGVSTFRSAATTVYGAPAPSSGGQGTRLYGKWGVGWVWV
jgi:hypothetical protein